MPGEDLHLSMLVRLQAHLNRCAVGADKSGFSFHLLFSRRVS